MENFSELKQLVLLHFQVSGKEETVDYLHMYMNFKGIQNIYVYADKSEESEYRSIVNRFFGDEGLTQYQQFVLAGLDFLIWIRTKQYKEKEHILQDRRENLKQMLGIPQFINRVITVQGINEPDKSKIILYSYSSMLESLKNIMDEKILLPIYQGFAIDECDKRKKHLALGDFRRIVSHFDKSNALMKVIDVELRNKISHADLFLDITGVTYSVGGNKKHLSSSQLSEKVVGAALALQFFVLFYLRLFRSEAEKATP